VEVSPDLISTVTDTVVAEVTAWYGDAEDVRDAPGPKATPVPSGDQTG
jgi:hypothetical protein